MAKEEIVSDKQFLFLQQSFQLELFNNYALFEEERYIALHMSVGQLVGPLVCLFGSKVKVTVTLKIKTFVKLCQSCLSTEDLLCVIK